MHIILASALILAAGFDPPYLPPVGGVGIEARTLGARAFAMGGATAGVPDSNTVSVYNPAAAGWASATGLTWGLSGVSGDDANWTGKLGFPHVSLVFPIPWGITLSGCLSSRSRLSSGGDFTYDGGTGSASWEGGLTEGWFGLSARAGSALSFALGSRSTFGRVSGDFVVLPDSLAGPFIPLSTQYRDEAVFKPSSGLLFGAFWKAGAFNAGMSITTDRNGTLDIHRDGMGNLNQDTTLQYTIPGDFTAGVSVRPHRRLLVAADFYSRKRLNLLEASVEPGTIYSGGIEYTASGNIWLRGGVSLTEGLWRDGATKYTTGVGYSFGSGRASVDLGAAYETWGDGLTETTVYATLWASENWLK
jgi:hypothetical protein